MTVSSQAAPWIAGAIFFVVLYGALLWLIWHKRKTEKIVPRAPDAQPANDLPVGIKLMGPGASVDNCMVVGLGVEMHGQDTRVSRSGIYKDFPKTLDYARKVQPLTLSEDGEPEIARVHWIGEHSKSAADEMMQQMRDAGARVIVLGMLDKVDPPLTQEVEVRNGIVFVDTNYERPN